jgi:hypothetical protein
METPAYILALAVLLGLLFHGWPKLITINHYHNKEKDNG